jgi:hypothetical protein
MQLPESIEGLLSQIREDGKTAKIVYFMEDYIGNDD